MFVLPTSPACAALEAASVAPATGKNIFLIIYTILLM
jgi:hypothetical protein